MRARTRPDDRVAEAAQRRLEALVAELGGSPPVRREEPEQDTDSTSDLGAEDESDDQRAEEEVLGRHARRPLPSSRRAASWAGDRLPPSVAGLRLSGRHLAAVGMVLLIGVVLAGWSYLEATRGPVAGDEVVAPRATGGVEVASAPSGGPSPTAAQNGEPPGGPGADAASDAASGAPDVVVDIEGKVRRPGIAVLPAGSRVADALKAAGGARPQADLQALNLARLLVDGEQLLVGVDPPAGVAAGTLAGPSAAPGATSGTAPVALVDLNTADQTALETLPGVGPVTAAAILEWRTEHGAFTSVDELLEVSGIGDATLAEIAPHVTL